MADERAVRWQKIAMDQLGHALNLILTLTIAVLGYWFFLLREDDFTSGSSAKCLMILSLLMLGFSALCGLACVLNRLRDVRGTAKRAREDSAAPTRAELRVVGDWTWGLFYAHLASFAGGVILLAISLLLTYGSKLV